MQGPSYPNHCDQCIQRTLLDVFAIAVTAMALHPSNYYTHKTYNTVGH